jgi:hypothetical protein
MTKNAPKRNRNIIGVSIGVKVKCKITPISVIGRIEGITSLNLAVKIFKLRVPFSFLG